MPELTREIVRSAPQFTNPLKKRELSLRGMHLTQLPLTDSKLWSDIVANFDFLDLSDNLLSWVDSPALLSASEQNKLGTSSSSSATKNNDPSSSTNQQQHHHYYDKEQQAIVDSEVDDFLSFLTVADNHQVTSNNSKLVVKEDKSNGSTVPVIRLSAIILHNNSLRGISRNFAVQLKSSLTSLILNQNGISDLASCDVFGEFEILERLSLVGNPVTKHQNYRLYVIGTCAKSLKLLDFAKVKDVEREEGKSVVSAEKLLMKSKNNNGMGAASLLSLDSATGVGIGGGRRAARKAAASAANVVAQGDLLDSKRSRDATEQEILQNADAISISTKIGNAHGMMTMMHQNNERNQNDETQQQQQHQKKKYSKEELMEMLDAATTVEEMDRIEAMMQSLED